jgi:hypothetical protein
MCEDCAIFDRAFTTMQLLTIFCKVNMDDDLYEQDEGDADGSRELVFDEFEEVYAYPFRREAIGGCREASTTQSVVLPRGAGCSPPLSPL